MKATITDVAKHAGVSMKTVSRVLNNEPNVAQKTRDHVKAVATKLRYTPNLAARGLATSKSYLLALMYDNPSPNYIAHIQRGAIDACRETGYHLVVEPLSLGSAKTDDEQAQAIRSVLDHLPVDGVILTPPLCDSQAVMDTLEELKIDYVRVGPRDGGTDPFVSMDDDAAAHDMTEHLLKLGHKRIGFIKGHVAHSATAARFNGYCRALTAAGVEVRHRFVTTGDFSFASGVDAAKTLLALPADQRPTAIFASNDDMAAAVVAVAGELGLSVPQDLSVCGFDDTPLAQTVWPPLTTVKQPIYRMGYDAAKHLMTRKAERGPDGRILDFEIMLRDSTSAPQ
jgi:LacI family transcriptional regulator